MADAVKIVALVKGFGNTRAINNLNFSIAEGQVFGLLGPNGSGKSTLMKMMTGIIKPTSGGIRIFNDDPQKNPIAVRRTIGYVPETPRLYDFLTARECLDFIADVYGVPFDAKKEMIAHFLDAFDLKGREDEMMSEYSQGMRQKVAIAGAMMHKPKLLIMDEPLKGLDPRSAKIVKAAGLFHIRRNVRSFDDGNRYCAKKTVLGALACYCTALRPKRGQTLSGGIAWQAWLYGTRISNNA